MTAFTRFDIVGLGASTVDVIARVDHLPGSDEVMQAMEMKTSGGGPVATAMVTLSRLGARTAMLDALGDDWRARIIRDAFARDGVDTTYVRVRPGSESPTSSILVERNTGARSIIYSHGTAPELDPTELPLDLIAAARILHVNGRHWAACLQAVRVARAAGALISFDGGSGRHRPELDGLLKMVDVCVVTADFARRHTREVDPRRAAAAFLRLGAQIAVITDGKAGSWALSREGEDLHQPAFAMPETIDTTGCGDSYHGAFLFGLLRGDGLRQSAALASAVAALNTRALGGRDALPTLAEAEAFLSAASSGA